MKYLQLQWANRPTRVRVGLGLMLQKLLFHNLQHFHGANLGTDAAGNALGSRAIGLHDHNLHGASLNTLTAGNTQLLVDHVHAGLGVLGDSASLTGLHALTTLDADSGLGFAGLVGADLNGAEGHVKFLIECFGASLNTLQASHALGIFLNSELLHREKSPLFMYLHNRLYMVKTKKATKKTGKTKLFELP